MPAGQPEPDDEADACANPDGAIFPQTEFDPLRGGIEDADELGQHAAAAAIFAERLRENHKEKALGASDDVDDVFTVAYGSEFSRASLLRAKPHLTRELVDVGGDQFQQLGMISLRLIRRFLFAEKHELVPLLVKLRHLRHVVERTRLDGPETFRDAQNAVGRDSDLRQDQPHFAQQRRQRERLYQKTARSRRDRNGGVG